MQNLSWCTHLCHQLASDDEQETGLAYIGPLCLILLLPPLCMYRQYMYLLSCNKVIITFTVTVMFSDIHNNDMLPRIIVGVSQDILVDILTLFHCSHFRTTKYLITYNYTIFMLIKKGLTSNISLLLNCISVRLACTLCTSQPCISLHSTCTYMLIGQLQPTLLVGMFSGHRQKPKRHEKISKKFEHFSLVKVTMTNQNCANLI